MNKVSKKLRLGILFGGPSSEHEISIITGLQAIKALDTRKFEIIPFYVSFDGRWYTGDKLLDQQNYRNFNAQKFQEVILFPNSNHSGPVELNGQYLGQEIPIDVFLLAFHGQFGEDGKIQSLLSLSQIPYTGHDNLTSSLCMNKSLCKKVISPDIPVLPWKTLTKEELAQKNFKLTPEFLDLGEYPLFVKPNNLGSSVAVSKANNDKELLVALIKVFKYDTQAIIEPCVEELMELNMSVIGTPSKARVSSIEIPVTDKNFLSYEEKYMRKGSKKTGPQRLDGMAGLARVIDPEDLDPNIKAEVTKLSLKAFQMLNCHGLVRIDFMMDKKTNKLYFNEVNPIPGSLSYYLWSPKTLYTDILEELIELALSKSREEKMLLTNFGFHALR